MGLVKTLHMTCALLSVSGFFVRGIWMVKESALLQARWVKITPHVVDTLLLVTAITLASQWGWDALSTPWILAKIVALLLYIALGTVALKRGKTKPVRVAAWLGALAVFAYIVSVAVTKNVLVVA